MDSNAGFDSGAKVGLVSSISGVVFSFESLFEQVKFDVQLSIGFRRSPENVSVTDPPENRAPQPSVPRVLRRTEVLGCP